MTGGYGVIAERVLAFFRESRGLPDDFELGHETPLVQSGLVDSLGMEELIVFLEGEFDIQLEDEDLMPENFDSLSGIVALVERKQAEG